MNPNTPSTIETASGRMFDLILPDPTLIGLDDVAHALAHICRFTGHTSRFYSVAEHSVLCSEYAEEQWGERLALLALLHDAAEAYVGDINTPFKLLLGGAAKDPERHIQQVIWRAANLAPPMAEECQKMKLADRILLATEAFYLLPSKGRFLNVPALPDPHIDIVGWLPLKACDRFHERADELGLGMMGDE